MDSQNSVTYNLLIVCLEQTLVYCIFQRLFIRRLFNISNRKCMLETQDINSNEVSEEI